MKIRIPKNMRGVANPHVLTIDLKSFDIDFFLPSLFFVVWASGAPMGRRTNDPTAIRTFVEKLASHPDLIGFDRPDGVRLLERITRSTLIVVGGKGRSHAGEQISALQPYSLLTSKSGFPKERSRLLNVDTFIYQALFNSLAGAAHSVEQTLRDYFKEVFGQGVRMDLRPLLDGKYDGKTPLDTLTRLSLAFLDGFEPTSFGKRSNRHLQQTSCPALTASLGNDILRYLFNYSPVMPATALTYNLQALITIELFVYTLKVVHAINALVDNPLRMPEAMRDTAYVSPPELYLDFTGTRGGLSQIMASHCVRRDIEAYQRFMTSNLLLRQLGGYVEQLRRIPSRATRIQEILAHTTGGPQYLQGLLLLTQDEEIGPQIEHKAAGDEELIRQQYVNEDGEAAEDLAILDEVVAGAKTAIDRVVALLSEGQDKIVLKNYTSWFSTVGGLRKPHGILTGSSNSRLSWRYAPSNDLLAVLVQLAATQANGEMQPHGAKPGASAPPRPIRLRDFLQYLERRFGILIDRPPAQFTGADAAAAARENLHAMLGRLRQMGIFSDLSDDFTVQLLQPPYADERRVAQRS